MVLSDKGDWVKVFDPRDSTIFVARDAPPAIGEQVRIDLVVGSHGPKVILRGKVIARRVKGDNALPRGCSVARIEDAICDGGRLDRTTRSADG